MTRPLDLARLYLALADRDINTVKLLAGVPDRIPCHGAGLSKNMREDIGKDPSHARNRP
jgi:hypothetical protein